MTTQMSTSLSKMGSPAAQVLVNAYHVVMTASDEITTLAHKIRRTLRKASHDIARRVR